MPINIFDHYMYPFVVIRVKDVFTRPTAWFFYPTCQRSCKSNAKRKLVFRLCWGAADVRGVASKSTLSSSPFPFRWRCKGRMRLCDWKRYSPITISIALQTSPNPFVYRKKKFLEKIMRLKAEAFNRTFQSQKHKKSPAHPYDERDPWKEYCLMSPYKAATFFNSSVIARLMKSLIVVPVAATKAATRECNSDDIRRFSFPL